MNFLIKPILYINKKYFFKKKHPFNLAKDWILNINYSDFEYEHTESLLKTYNVLINKEEFKEKNILEVGCWWWWKSIYIAEHYNSFVTGIDLNWIFLDQAKIKAKEKKVEDKTVFLCEDALNTSFKEWGFDIIILSDVLEHIPDTEKLLNECYRILKKGWFIVFDFAPYYHYFWHHIWDTIQIPWLHLFTSEKFRIKLYKESVKNMPDAKNRIQLRVGKWMKTESFTYLNKISRKKFEKIINIFLYKWNIDSNINYYMLKNISIFSKIPFLREVFIRHIVWVINKK